MKNSNQTTGNVLVLFNHNNTISIFKRSFALLIFCFITLCAKAQINANDIVGNYMVPSKDGAIQIYESNNKFYGKIILNKDASKLDVHNPDKERQTRKVLGLNILNDFTFAGNNLWENGTIYDPKNGKTYSCKIMRNENGDLNIRGFIGISVLGRTEVFTKLNK